LHKLFKLFHNVGFWFSLTLAAFGGVIYLHFITGVFSEAQTDLNYSLEAYYLISNLLIGSLVSFLFYYLVVGLPESRKRQVIKTNLIKTYNSIKTEIIWQIVFASREGGRHDLETSSDFVESLLDLKKFKEVFGNGRESNEGYYAFQNQMSEQTPQFDEIILSLNYLQKQIEFALHNFSVENQDTFDFLKRLEMLLMRLQKTEPGYDGSNQLCSFLWQICTGWHPINGYQNLDPVEKLIAEI
jgi:hypothetical protein